MTSEQKTQLAAKIEIVKILAPLEQYQREHLVNAAQLLINADRIVPGVLAQFLAGAEKVSR